MKILSTVILATLSFSAATLHAATPEQEKAFVESYKKAFEAKDEKALVGFLYTEGAPADIVAMFKSMQVGQAGEKIKSIELVTPSKEDAARYNEPQEMPDGKTYRMPFNPSKQLVIVTEQKSDSGSSTSTTRKPVGEKDGKLVIPVPVPAKAEATKPGKKKAK